MLTLTVAAALMPATLGAAGPATSGEGWVLVELDTETTVRLSIRFDWHGPTTAIIRPFKLDSFDYGPLAPVAPGGQISVGVAGEEVDSPAGLKGAAAGFGTWLDGPRVYRVAFIVGGGPLSWSYAVDGESVTWREVARGSTVHSFEPRDFGPIGADVRVPAADAFVAYGTRSVAIEHEIVGVAGHSELYRPNAPTAHVSPPVYPNEFGVRGPGGAADCPCWFPHPTEPTPSGPGDYTFDWRGVGVRAYHGPMVVVADIPVFG